MSFRNFFAGIMARAGVVSDPEFSSGFFTVNDAAAGPPAEAEIRLNQSGNSVNGIRLNLPDSLLGTWGSGLLDITDYDFRWDITSGSLNSPGSQAGNTWITGFDGMYWGVRENGSGITACNGTLRVRPAGGGADFDTAIVSVVAETV